MDRLERRPLRIPLRLTALAGTLVLLAACGPTGGSGTSRGPGPDPSVSPSPSASAIPAVTSVPDAALLQKADLGGGEVIAGGGINPLLSPCWPPQNNDTAVVVRRDETVTFRFTDVREPYTNRKVPDGDAGEIILVCTPGAAAEYLRQLRAQLTQCATVPREDVLWRHAVVGTSYAGDESLMWQRTVTQREPSGIRYTATELVAVMRFGDVVVVVDGYTENVVLTRTTRTGLVDRALFTRVVTAAAHRAASIGPG